MHIPASLCGLSDHRREPRWIFARFPLNGAKALAEAMPVQTPGSGKRRSDRFTIFCQSLQLLGETYRSFRSEFSLLGIFRLHKLKRWDRKRYRW